MPESRCGAHHDVFWGNTEEELIAEEERHYREHEIWSGGTMTHECRTFYLGKSGSRYRSYENGGWVLIENGRLIDSEKGKKL